MFQDSQDTIRGFEVFNSDFIVPTLYNLLCFFRLYQKKKQNKIRTYYPELVQFIPSNFPNDTSGVTVNVSEIVNPYDQEIIYKIN